MGLIAMPTFMFFDFMCEISFSISWFDESASMWKQYKSTQSLAHVSKIKYVDICRKQKVTSILE